MDWNTPSLDTLLARIWERLQQGCWNRQDPWHTAALATMDNGRPAVRTVVLRSVEMATRALGFFSDVRADKIRQLSGSPRAEWMFYDPMEHLQLRAHTVVMVHHQNATAEAAWNSKPELNYLHYLSPLPPGTELPAFLPIRDTLEQEDEIAFRNFAVVIATVEYFDWLLVEETRHRRASFHWEGAGLESRWVVP